MRGEVEGEIERRDGEERWREEMSRRGAVDE